MILTMKKRWLLLPAVGIVGAGLPYRFDVTRYTILTPKVKQAIRLVVLADVHNTSYGEHMERLVNLVKEENPDLILFPGDLFQEEGNNQNSYTLLKELSDYTMFFSNGNHEEKRRDLDQVLEQAKQDSFYVVNNRALLVHADETELEIGGIQSKERYTPQQVNNLFQNDCFRILLSHRPERMSLYEQLDCDLTICGHAHGGQWCIPRTRIGAFAPNQGLLPEYIYGLHEAGKNNVIISRGITWHYHGIPRLYNNPELVVITLEPKHIDN